MTTETMNVHQALAELKMLDKRIPEEIVAPMWVMANKHSNTKVGGIPVGEYVNNTKAQYQKVNDLIRRAEAIKRAVVKSNAETKINVGGVEYTVAEAIDMKDNGIPRLKKLRDRLVAHLRDAEQTCDYENDKRLELRATQHIETMFGKSDAKGLSEEMKAAREEFIKQQTYELVDPIGAKKEIEALTDRIDKFTVNVDAALSTSNALTEITVSY